MMLRNAFTALCCAALYACAWSGYEADYFSTGHVRVLHQQNVCTPQGDEVPDAELIYSGNIGLGRLVATRNAWEVYARQIAMESDADIALVSPCPDASSSRSFEHAQISVWRSTDFTAPLNEPMPAPQTTLVPPPDTSYATRLNDIFACSTGASARAGYTEGMSLILAEIDATEFFSSDWYFPGYARIDEHFRPTRSGSKATSMLSSQRQQADRSASSYLALSPPERARFARQYLSCLWGKGYRL